MLNKETIPVKTYVVIKDSTKAVIFKETEFLLNIRAISHYHERIQEWNDYTQNKLFNEQK